MKAELEGLNRYPDGACDKLRSILAQSRHVPEECFVFGNGSCELLMLLAQAFLGPQRHVIFPHPSFVMYRTIALAHEAPFTAVSLRDLDYDLDAMVAAVRDDTSLLIICNPNNPTGSYVEPAALRSFVRRVPPGVVVVLDEAYGEFVAPPRHEDSATWLADHPNLVILHTFSKIFGLAGLRVGYGMAHREIVQALDKVRQPFNVDSLAQVAAAASLRQPGRMRERREWVAAERDRLATRLGAIGVACHPSQANFLLVDVTRLGIPGPEVAQALLERGILTRSGYAMDCPGWIRVTIGEVGEGDLFLSAMAELREAGSGTAGSHVVGGLTAEALSPES
jgi:histidinol-phosphate aminotransferase